MRKVTLIFPDTNRIAEFLINYQIKHAEVISGSKTLKCIINDDELVKACTEYKAILYNSQVIDYKEVL